MLHACPDGVHDSKPESTLSSAVTSPSWRGFWRENRKHYPTPEILNSTFQSFKQQIIYKIFHWIKPNLNLTYENQNLCSKKNHISMIRKTLWRTIVIPTNSKNKDYLLENLQPHLYYKQKLFASMSSPRTQLISRILKHLDLLTNDW